MTHLSGTLERAKADPLTCYVPPLNTLALLVLFPLRFLLSPRYVPSLWHSPTSSTDRSTPHPRSAFHKAQVYLARALNLPILLSLALWARLSSSRRLSSSSSYSRGALALARDLPRRLGSWDLWEGKVEHLVGEVWLRGVNDVGTTVASFDGEGPAPARDLPGQGKGKAPQRAGAGVGGGKESAAAGAAGAKARKAPPPALSPRSTSAAAAAAGPSERLGSLDSPLARLFAPGASLGAALHSAAGPSRSSAGGASEARAGAGAETETSARLQRIEEALQLLLGEVVKTGAAGRGARGEDGEGGGGGGEEERAVDGPVGDGRAELCG